MQKKTNDGECSREARAFGRAKDETEDIGGMSFAHGSDEHGQLCVESRDEVFTAYRKGACYRFDLTVNTFCAATSGALEMSRSQMADIRGRMDAILGSVRLDWSKNAVPDTPKGKTPRRALPPTSGKNSQAE